MQLLHSSLSFLEIPVKSESIEDVNDRVTERLKNQWQPVVAIILLLNSVSLIATLKLPRWGLQRCAETLSQRADQENSPIDGTRSGSILTYTSLVVLNVRNKRPIHPYAHLSKVRNARLFISEHILIRIHVRCTHVVEP